MQVKNNTAQGVVPTSDAEARIAEAAETILRAIGDERLHVVLYGERGRGKTSLINLVAEAGRSDGYIFARYSCSAESDFDAIMRGLARDLPASLLAMPLAAQGEAEGCEAALPAGRLEPRDIALGEARDLLRLEPLERALERLALLQDRDPREPRLEAVEHELLEERAVVDDRHAPLGVVVRDIDGIGAAPPAAFGEGRL